ncbi:ABC-type transport auxiliary lipoprotein family protein [Hydrogenimonas cancrithermarum]|uniref:ABC transporter n=1 Tax=Hydrogenimonas cancrithermarum TaxID=2993563 RepID=A0ABN6WSN6_9BACT|nr:ABC-type transport auxiliary lipoprotein family protein [Hydrogenimonas cancrithermarum]BDY12096.1 ABC transporter [Hydrogenimonas cancrithermarum]
MKWSIVLASLLLLGGCSIKRVPSPMTYTLNQETPALTRLRLENPRFDTIRLAFNHSTKLSESSTLYYRKAGYLHQPYAYSRWYDSVDSMLENKLLYALRQSNIARTVLPAATHADTEMVLEISLINFVHDFSKGTPSKGVVRMIATLIENRNGKTVASETFEAAVPALSEDAKGGVAALNRATDEVVVSLIMWLEAD